MSRKAKTASERRREQRRAQERADAQAAPWIATAAASLANHQTHVEVGVRAFDCAACRA